MPSETPHQPRRRKKPATTAKKRPTDGRSGLAASMSMNDDECCSFASSAAASEGSSGASRGSGGAGGRKGGSQSSSRAAVDKENKVNAGRRDKSQKNKATAAEQDASREFVTSRSKKAAKGGGKKHDSMEALSDSLAQVNLDRQGSNGCSSGNANGEAEKKLVADYQPGPFPPKGHAAKNIALSKDETPKAILKDALQTMKQLGTNDAVVKLFQTPSLLAAVASASYSMGPPDSLLLEENAPKLIDAAKRCLKSLSASSGDKSSKKSDADEGPELALLRVAVHSLRSVVPTLLKGGQSKSNVPVATKLLYHCVVLAGDACHKTFREFAEAGSKSKEMDVPAAMEYAIVCLGAYEGLGRCLRAGTKGPKAKNSTVAWEEMLPAPAAGNAQRTKMGLESALCAASSLLYLSLGSLFARARRVEAEWAVPNEFHFALSVVSEACLGQCEGTPSFHRVMSNAACPYVAQTLFPSAEEGAPPAFDADALRHVKKAFRVLWDGARSVEDVCHLRDGSALRTSCLDLQGEAVLSIVRTLKEAFRMSPNLMKEASSSGRKELLALFDRASSSAMKASGSFEKATKVLAQSSASKEGTDNSSLQRKKSALLRFHAVVGGELDEVAMQLCSETSAGKRKRPLLPASYFEYCVYRSVHRWRLIGLASGEHIPTSSSIDDDGTKAKGEEAEAMVAASTLSVVQLVLQARQSLKSGTELKTAGIDCEQFTSSFGLLINSAQPSSLSRCRSMLTMLDLQREASNLLTSVQARDGSFSAKGRHTAILALVMGRCLAPLEARLAGAAKEPPRSLTYRLSSADCRTKASALFDVAMEHSEPGDPREKWMEEADAQLCKSYELLLSELGRLQKGGFDRKAAPVSAVELFAKMANFIGSRRFDRKEISASIQPQIFATEILSKVAIRACDKKLFHTYQMPNRFMQLSTALGANGSPAEACAALAMAAWCSIEVIASSAFKAAQDEAVEVEGDTTSEEILLFPEGTFLGTISPEDGGTEAFAKTIGRLTRSYMDYRSANRGDDTPAESSLTQMMKGTLMGKVIEVAGSSSSRDGESGQIRLSKLLHCAVWNQTRYEEELSTAQIADIVREVLRSTIKVFLKSDLADSDFETSSSHIIGELKLFVQAQTKRLGDSADAELLQVVASSLHVSFASHLVQSRLLYFPRSTSWVSCKSAVNRREHGLLQYACSQLKMAENQFVSASEDEQQIDLCFFAQWAAVQLHSAILVEQLSLAKLSKDVCKSGGSISEHSLSDQASSVAPNYASALSTARRAIARLSNTEEEVYPEAVESLLSTLKRLLCWFSYHSDPVSATESCNLLQDLYSLVEEPPFPAAVSGFLSVSSKQEHLATSLASPNKLLNESESDSVLRDAVALTLSIIGGQSAREASTPELDESLRQTFDSLETEMGALSDSLDGNESGDDDASSATDATIQKQLSAIQLLMLHAKLCLDEGQPASAVRYLGWCRPQCKNLLRFVRVARGCSNNVRLEDVSIQVEDTTTMIFDALAAAFLLLGIRRKAEDYSMMAALKLHLLDKDCPYSRIRVQELIDSVEQYDGHECYLHPIRSLIKSKAMSTSADKLASQELAVGIGACSSASVDRSDKAACVNSVLSKSKNALAYDACLRQLPSFAEKSHLHMERVYKELDRSSANEDMACFTRRAGAELKLRLCRGPGPGLLEIDSADESTAATLKEIADGKSGSGVCSAEAYYRLGLIALDKARESGELEAVWGKHAINSPNGGDVCDDLDLGDLEPLTHTLEARQYFGSALESAPPASFSLTKNILRCLALITGPREGDGLATASLINISVGGSARNVVRNALDGGTALDAFQIFDDESLDHCARVEAVGQLLSDSAGALPCNWNICTMATCPTGELLVTSVRVSATSGGDNVTDVSTVCVFPHSRTISDANDLNTGIHSDVLTPLDRIIERSQRQLKGMTEDAQSELYSKEEARRVWWKERYSTDEDLQSLLKRTESAYFSHPSVRHSLLPFEEGETASNCDDDSSECSALGPGNLESRFAEAEREPLESIMNPSGFEKDVERSRLAKMTVATIKSELASIGVADGDIKKMRKADLIDLLLGEMEKGCSSERMIDLASIPGDDDSAASPELKTSFCQEEQCEISRTPEEPCTILVLDEHLLRFPFESMEMFSGRTVTRVPSLPFVLATLLETKELHSTATPKADARKMKYVLDPESNLSESANTLKPALNDIAASKGWEWEGVVGRIPPTEFMTEALSEEKGLYLYCGHGGGEKAFSKHQAEALMTSREDGIRGCRSPIVLMGCSSGKLQSVNTPKENPSGRVHEMHYEPEGIALSYLFAGAPCVVGNLWDVTDRDIDRYCLTLMKDFVQCPDEDGCAPRTGPSLARCVASARRACKLRYIVGSAPVCYGVPVILDTSNA